MEGEFMPAAMSDVAEASYSVKNELAVLAYWEIGTIHIPKVR